MAGQRLSQMEGGVCESPALSVREGDGGARRGSSRIRVHVRQLWAQDLPLPRPSHTGRLSPERSGNFPRATQRGLSGSGFELRTTGARRLHARRVLQAPRAPSGAFLLLQVTGQRWSNSAWQQGVTVPLPSNAASI